MIECYPLRRCWTLKLNTTLSMGLKWQYLLFDKCILSDLCNILLFSAHCPVLDYKTRHQSGSFYLDTSTYQMRQMTALPFNLDPRASRIFYGCTFLYPPLGTHFFCCPCVDVCNKNLGKKVVIKNCQSQSRNQSCVPLQIDFCWFLHIKIGNFNRKIKHYFISVQS